MSFVGEMVRNGGLYFMISSLEGHHSRVCGTFPMYGIIFWWPYVPHTLVRCVYMNYNLYTVSLR